MQTSIHFEQFFEEIRSRYPAAETICATEEPLSVQIDGQIISPDPFVSNHHPLWLEVTPGSILADGNQASVLSIQCPDYTNQTLAFSLVHGTSVVKEQITPDSQGKAELEICSHTPGTITIQCLDLPVRAQIIANAG
jgi:hypothetical protein